MQSQEFNRKQTEVMLELLRASIFDREPHVESTDEVDWDNMMESAGEQRILGWVWDGIQKLPTDKQPSRQQRINWALSAQEIADFYTRQKDQLRYLLEVCEKNDMRMLMFKGLDFANLYSKPELRKYGDIDCFFFGDYDKFNRLFAEYYDPNNHESKLHAELFFGERESFEVENHRIFVVPNTIQRKIINDYLMSSVEDAVLTDVGYWVFSPIAYLVFLTSHALGHLGALPMRTIVDFAMWLNAHKSEIPSDICNSIMRRFGLGKGFEVLLIMSNHIIGIRFDEYRRGLIPSEYIEFLKKWIDSGYCNTHSLSNSISKLLYKSEENGIIAYISERSRHKEDMQMIKKCSRYSLYDNTGTFWYHKYVNIVNFMRAVLKVRPDGHLKDAISMRKKT